MTVTVPRSVSVQRCALHPFGPSQPQAVGRQWGFFVLYSKLATMPKGQAELMTQGTWEPSWVNPDIPAWRQRNICP